MAVSSQVYALYRINELQVHNTKGTTLTPTKVSGQC